jgi:hypothetical protein
MIQRLLTLCLLMFFIQSASAQTASVKGAVRDADNNAPMVNLSVVVSGTGLFAVTGNDGSFTISNIPAGDYKLVVSHFGYLPQELSLNAPTGGEFQLDFDLKRDPVANSTNGEIPSITLEEAESETDGSGEVANLLNASRDIFQRLSGFGWGNFRFRERGYDSEFFPLFLNGVNINDPETGFTVFGEIAGLNDVLRYRETSVGLNLCEFAFGELGGATRLDTRASTHRKQIRATYAVANRTFTNRAMLTYSTGLLPGGWALSLSGSRRWGQEGYFDGTYFDGYSYFISADKKFGRAHSINVTVLASPSIRGKQGDTFQEMYDLAGKLGFRA